MANNYSVSSFTLFSPTAVEPVLGRLAQVIVEATCLQYEKGDVLLVVDTEQYGSLNSDHLFTAIAEHAEIELSTYPLIKDFLSALKERCVINQITFDKLSEYLGSFTFTEDDYDPLSLGDLLYCLLWEEGCTINAIYEEFGYYCDKSRHGNFGGGSAVWTKDFITSQNSSLGYDIAQKLSYLMDTTQTITNFIASEVTHLLSGIRDPQERSLVKQQLVKSLSENLSE